MNKSLKEKLISIAREKTLPDDPSHDINHILRVLRNAEFIAKKEGGDLDILIPSVLFHDIVNYPKNDPRASKASDESADVARSILLNIKEFPKNKIDKVASAIRTCSFSKGLVPDGKEGKILQDADGLEALGAIGIMRTFSGTAMYKRSFFYLEDPFCKKRKPDQFKYSLDLFYVRLLVIQSRLHTETAKKLGNSRTQFLKKFLKQVEIELI